MNAKPISFGILFGLITIIFISFSGCQKDNPVNPSDGKTLIDTTINASSNDIIVTLPGKLFIKIPQGTVKESTNLTILEVPLSKHPSTNELRVLKAFNIKLGTISTFSKPLIIRLYYNTSELPTEAKKANFTAAWFNEPISRWNLYKNVTNDSLNNFVSFETSHLTDVCLSEYLTTGGYTDKFENAYFTIYYMKTGNNAVMNNTDYNNNTQQPWHIKTGSEANTPYYIQDLAHWLFEAYNAYKDTYKFTLSKDRIFVYVRQLSGADGEFGSITGAVYINSRLVIQAEDQSYTIPEQLQSVAAHELLHYVQDYYYVMNKGNSGLWWLEATATQADRLVWGNKLKHYESILWSMKQDVTLGSVLGYNISKSWDDCSGSPKHYAAGCFLSYIANYGVASLNIADVIKAGGSNTELSYFRTILDEKIKNLFPTNSIGKEYINYVKWLFEAAGEMSLFYTPFANVPNPDNAYEYPIVFTSSNKSATINFSLPYLSARVVKLKNSGIDNQQAKIKCVNIPKDMIAYLYFRHKKGADSLKYLNINDEFFFDLPKGKMLDILIINGSKDNNLTPNIEVLFADTKETPVNLDIKDKFYSGQQCDIVNQIFKITGKITTSSEDEIKINNSYGSTPDIGVFVKSLDHTVSMNLTISTSFSPSDFRVWDGYNEGNADTVFYHVDKIKFEVQDDYDNTMHVLEGKDNGDGTYTIKINLDPKKHFPPDPAIVRWIRFTPIFECNLRKFWVSTNTTKYESEELHHCVVTINFWKDY